MEPCLKIDTWKTLDYPIKKVGNVEITNQHYKGFYLMEGVDGYAMFEATKRIPIKILKIDGQQWMVDDPLHWIGMKRLAENSEGNVLVGGLGLGLVAYHLLKNPKVEKITIIEMNKNVIKLVGKLFANNNKVQIIQGNVKDYSWMKKDVYYDTIILDIWTYNGGKKNIRIWAEMVSCISSFEHTYPNSKVFVWGLRDKKHNPSVKDMPQEYFELIKIISDG